MRCCMGRPSRCARAARTRWVKRSAVEHVANDEHHQQACAEPRTDHESRPGSADGSICYLTGPLPAVRHDRMRDQLERQCYAEWHYHQVVQIADHWNEIRDQVERAEGIGYDRGRDSLRVP